MVQRRTYVENFTALQLAIERAEDMRVRRDAVNLKREYEIRRDARRSTRNLCALINLVMFTVCIVIAAALYYFDCDPFGGLITDIAIGGAYGIVPVAVGWYFYSLWKGRVEERANMKPVLSGSPADVLMLSMHFDDPEARAAAVFESVLTQSQLNQWKETKQVTVPLPRGGAAIIGTGKVEWSDGNNQCVGPALNQHECWMPMGDILLCQLLYLRSDPNYVRSVGKLSSVQRMSGRTAISRATVH